MTAKTYRILIDAPFVAGRRSPGKGESLHLTEAEAEHAVILGHLAAEPAEPAAGAEGEPSAPLTTKRGGKA